MSCTLYADVRLLLLFSQNSCGFAAEEALAVGGALVLDFDVEAGITCS